MDSRQAVKPEFFNNFPSLVRQQAEAQKAGVTAEEQLLFGMSQTAGWKLFTDKTNELLKDMDSFIDSAVANGLSPQDIGEKTIVISLARGIIKRLLDFVNDAKEQCERQAGIS